MGKGENGKSSGESEEGSRFINSSSDEQFKHSSQETKSFIKQSKDRTKDSKTYKKPGKFWNALAYCLITLNMILLVSILGVTIKWRCERNAALTVEQKEQEFCLPCDKLSSHPDKDLTHLGKDFLIKNERNETVCCGKTSKHLDTLVTKFVEQKHTAYRPLRTYKDITDGCKSITKDKPAARVVGLQKHLIGNRSDVPLQWDIDAKLSFTKGGIQYSIDHFTVNKSGYYYIYSQLLFLNAGNESFAAWNNILHSVQKYNKRLDTFETLLEGTNSRCKSLTGEGSKTSYVGAVFSINFGDKIFVKVSNSNGIVQTENDNFFGMYLI